MSIKNMPISWNYNYNNVVGVFSVDDSVAKVLEEGNELILSPVVVVKSDGKKVVVGLTLRPEPPGVKRD